MKPPHKPVGGLPRINFRLDEETLAALVDLEKALPNVRGRRSVLLRQLILDAHARLRPASSEPIR